MAETVLLYSSLLVIGVIVAVGHDDMIHKRETHEVAGSLELQGQGVIGLAGTDAA